MERMACGCFRTVRNRPRRTSVYLFGASPVKSCPLHRSATSSTRPHRRDNCRFASVRFPGDSSIHVWIAFLLLLLFCRVPSHLVDPQVHPFLLVSTQQDHSLSYAVHSGPSSLGTHVHSLGTVPCDGRLRYRRRPLLHMSAHLDLYRSSYVRICLRPSPYLSSFGTAVLVQGCFACCSDFTHYCPALRVSAHPFLSVVHIPGYSLVCRMVQGLPRLNCRPLRYNLLSEPAVRQATWNTNS